MLLRRYHNKPKTVKEAVTQTAPKPPVPVKEIASDYSREEIEKMPYFKIKAQAKRLGLSVDGKNTADLRELVLNALGM